MQVPICSGNIHSSQYKQQKYKILNERNFDIALYLLSQFQYKIIKLKVKLIQIKLT